MSKILFFFIILLSFNIQGKEFNNFSVDGINIKEASIEELQAEVSALKIKKKSQKNRQLLKAIQAEIDGRR